MTLTSDDLALARTAALRVPQCCPPAAEYPCDTCRVVRAVNALVLEVERLRAGLAPAPLYLVPSPLHEALVGNARALTLALGAHTPLTPAAHVARSKVDELLDEIERQAG